MGNLREAEKAVTAALRIDANYQPALKLLDAIKQGALGSNLTGSGPSPSPTSQHASSNPTHQKTSDERSLRRHYFYRGLVVVGVICVAFALMLSSKNETLRELKGQLSGIESQFAPLKNDNNSLRKKNTGLLNEKQELQGKLSEMETQLTSAKKENKRLKTENGGQRHRTQVFPILTASEIQELQNENKRLHRRNKELEKQLSQRETDLDSLTKENQASQIENARLLRQNRDLQDRLAQVPIEPAPPEGEYQISPKVEILEGHTNWVRSTAFSPDGKTLASGSRDKTIRL